MQMDALFKKRVIILVALAVLLVWWSRPAPQGLSIEGWRALSIIFLASLFWITNVIPPAYTSLLVLFLMMSTGIASFQAALTLWISPLGWLIIGAFLLAGAISKTGIGEKIVLTILGRGTINFPRLLLLIYLSQAVTTIIIPQPIPRCLMLITCYYGLIKHNNLPAADAARLGFIVFSSAPPVSTIILTGDSVLNPTTVALSGVALSWLGWFKYMAVPAVAATILTFLIHLKFFRIDMPVRSEGQGLRWHCLGRQEKAVFFWLAAAIIGWVTDFIHGINPAWIALGAAAFLALPLPRPVLTLGDISRYTSGHLLLFLTGAVALGSASRETGLAQWLALSLLPDIAVGSDLLVGLLVGGLSMLVHMVIGSVLATISVVTTPLIAFAGRVGWDPLATALIINTSVNLHYLLPFQNALILLGMGQKGYYGQKEILRFGLFMTAGVFLIMIVQVLWWRTVGLL